MGSSNLSVTDALFPGLSGKMVERAGAICTQIVYRGTSLIRTLQQGYAYGPMVILGAWRFLMIEVPL
jgi:hypothetical protein